jgi:hypothetical protein|tara:strand:- start:169 stop:618 length:450 start_codon:yes stop_codon:yes gene_type:complete
MKALTLFITLAIAVVFHSSSYADWTEMSKGVDGDTFYVDFEGIRKNDGYDYFWRLVDHLKPIQGYLSSKVCIQGDCKQFRLKYLSISYHKKPMGGGAGDTHNYKNPEWAYPPLGSSIEYILKLVCSKRSSRSFKSCERELPSSSARLEW